MKERLQIALQAPRCANKPKGSWHSQRLSLLAKYFANSLFLQVCGADFAILTQNSSNSIMQCTIYIQQHI